MAKYITRRSNVHNVEVAIYRPGIGTEIQMLKIQDFDASGNKALKQAQKLLPPGVVACEVLNAERMPGVYRMPAEEFYARAEYVAATEEEGGEDDE